jgi:hypothetical protein
MWNRILLCDQWSMVALQSGIGLTHGAAMQHRVKGPLPEHLHHNTLPGKAFEQVHLILTRIAA